MRIFSLYTTMWERVQFRSWSKIFVCGGYDITLSHWQRNREPSSWNSRAVQRVNTAQMTLLYVSFTGSIFAMSGVDVEQIFLTPFPYFQATFPFQHGCPILSDF